MTDDDRESGRWQGDVTARLRDLEKDMARISGRIDDQTHGLGAAHSQNELLRQKLGLLWTALGVVAASLASAIINIWSKGGF